MEVSVFSHILQGVCVMSFISQPTCSKKIIQRFAGVYYEKECSSTQLNHGVLLVGYGTDPEDGDYWLVKNRYFDYLRDRRYSHWENGCCEIIQRRKEYAEDRFFCFFAPVASFSFFSFCLFCILFWKFSERYAEKKRRERKGVWSKETEAILHRNIPYNLPEVFFAALQPFLPLSHYFHSRFSRRALTTNLSLIDRDDTGFEDNNGE